MTLALTDRNRDHIPYRQSKLTHILKDSIGGNCSTVMIANVWVEAEQVEETVSEMGDHGTLGVYSSPTHSLFGRDGGGLALYSILFVCHIYLVKVQLWWVCRHIFLVSPHSDCGAVKWPTYERPIFSPYMQISTLKFATRMMRVSNVSVKNVLQDPQVHTQCLKNTLWSLKLMDDNSFCSCFWKNMRKKSNLWDWNWQCMTPWWEHSVQELAIV